MKYSSIVLASMVLLLFWCLPHAVMACSGGGPTPLGALLDESTTVVKARVLDADAYGQVGVVEVIEYFVGTPDESLLLVMQTEPSRTLSLIENRNGPGGCAVLGYALTPDEEVYLFLVRNSDGTYTPKTAPNQFNYMTMAYRFPDLQTEVPVVTGDYGTIDTPATSKQEFITETEFRQILLAETQSQPTTPLSESRYPMPARILLTTTSGAYILQPDHSRPQLITESDVRNLRRSSGVWRNNPFGVTECVEVSCTAYSPSGLDQASVTSEGILLNGLLIAGEGFLFSPTNELVAIWNNNTLDFYTSRYPSLGMEEYGNTLYTSHVINQGDEWIGQAVWSNDGRLFVYTDINGLWLFDVYSQTPRLLIPANDTDSILQARYFSQGGRYLAIRETSSGKRSTLDLITMDLLPDGLFSPNERFLIAYDTASQVAMYSRCILTSPYPCQEIGLAREVFWLDATHYVISLCASIDATICNTVVMSVTCCSTPLGDNLIFDYELVTNTYLKIVGYTQIEIWDGYHTIDRDLQAFIEGDIIGAEWLPSLYYGQRVFSETVKRRYQSVLASFSSE